MPAELYGPQNGIHRGQLTDQPSLHGQRVWLLVLAPLDLVEHRGFRFAANVHHAKFAKPNGRCGASQQHSHFCCPNLSWSRALAQSGGYIDRITITIAVDRDGTQHVAFDGVPLPVRSISIDPVSLERLSDQPRTVRG